MIVAKEYNIAFLKKRKKKEEEKKNFPRKSRYYSDTVVRPCDYHGQRFSFLLQLGKGRYKKNSPGGVPTCERLEKNKVKCVCVCV